MRTICEGAQGGAWVLPKGVGGRGPAGRAAVFWTVSVWRDGLSLTKGGFIMRKQTQKPEAQIGELFQTVREMRLQGRGGHISPEDVESIGRLFEAVKKAVKKKKKTLDER